MHAIHASVKTNTVLVCKNLAEAQFRCMECCKAFISERHLAKHNQKKHGLTPYFMEGFEQRTVTRENDRKLAEVTGRLEKALSLLEAKTVSSHATESHERPGDAVREGAQLEVPKFRDEIPQKYPHNDLEVRRTVSLFTLPYNQAGGPIVDGWIAMDNPMMEQHEGASSGDVRNCGHKDFDSFSDGVQRVSQPHNMHDKSPPNEVIQKLSIPEDPSELKGVPGDVTVYGHSGHPKTPSPAGGTRVNDAEPRNHQVVTIEPLLINLIEKLDTVFSGNRIVTNSGCQTTDPFPELLDVSAGRKSVRFSDSPMYIGSSEHQFNLSESECSSPSSQSKLECDSRTDNAENHDFQTFTKYSGHNNFTRTVRKGPESSGDPTIASGAEGTRGFGCCLGEQDIDVSDSCNSPDIYETSDAKQDTTFLRADVERPQETEQSCTGDESENDCSQSRKTAILVADREAAAAAVATATEPTQAVDIEHSKITNPLTTVAERKSADYVATKRQILDIVEKCVQDLKAKRKQPKTAPVENPVLIRNHDSASTGQQGCPDTELKETVHLQMSEVRKNSNSHVICAGQGNITVDSQGILPPCTMICKDEEVDIDEFSGDSYERFMKRFYSRKSRSENGLEQPITPQQTPRPAGTARQDPTGGNEVNLKSDLKKSEYALLLHHETSQVQSLIDTLVMDLQRWRNARRDKLSQAIRLQLEERLASSLNLLGVQSDAKILPDSAAATAQFLLKTRRSKLAKGSQASYFDVVKYAFVNEVDRIAKSRVNDHDSPA